MNLNAGLDRVRRWRGGATVDPAGNVYFGWTAYAQPGDAERTGRRFREPLADGGRTWSTLLLDQSSAPPECEPNMRNGFLGAQIALASDAAGALYALWNAGSANGGPERIYFSSSTIQTGTGRRARAFRLAAPGVEQRFRQSSQERPGDVRIAWMDARAPRPGTQTGRCGIPSTAVRQTAARLERGVAVSSPVRRLRLHSAKRLPLPFRDYFGLAIDGDGKPMPSGAKDATINLPVRSGTLAANNSVQFTYRTEGACTSWA